MGKDAWMQAMRWCEKRKYKRVAVELELSCRKVGSPEEKAHSGRTVNVSPGGVYFHTGGQVFSTGDMLRIELSVPPNVGQLEFGGRVCALGRVLRNEPAGELGHASRRDWGLALEFCQSPRVSDWG